MVLSSVSAEATEKRAKFFDFAFGHEEGYICIAFLTNDAHQKKSGEHRPLLERYYRWPQQKQEMLDEITAKVPYYNAYYCPQLLATKRRSKDSVKTCPSIWADLDTCEPENLLVQPSMVVESSPGRYQALWFLEDVMPPQVAEDISRRIAYYHAPQGADKSGWDLSQLLRIPYTPNYKYGIVDPQQVVILKLSNALYRESEFDCYPNVAGMQHLGIPMPPEDHLPTDNPVDMMQSKRMSLNPTAFHLFEEEPENDWSSALWNFQLYLYEAGFSREEVFHIAKVAACNKYKRDNRASDLLWRDICRGHARHLENISVYVNLAKPQPELINEDELAAVADRETFVERYINWATGLGDAAPQYHQAGAFTVLSAVLSGSVRLPTSFGTIVPNLWFMILADTTLTRKSTAMDVAIDLLTDLDNDIVMATDGSIEGLLTGLSMRPGRPSLFYRDEFTGLIDAMVKKDYYAGMMEMLTKLYDNKMQKRMLRKETLEVHDPVFIMLAGGIRNRMQSMLSVDHVSSGFIPRFVFITAESDVTKLQALGPPSEQDTTGRDQRLNELNLMREFYDQHVEMILPNKKKVMQQRKWTAELSPDAWMRYNIFEKALLDMGMSSEQPEVMTPVYSRLAVSVLKASTLIAASEQRKEKIVIELDDMLHAIKYGQAWRDYANEVVNGIGHSFAEREMEKIFHNIQKNPGITRSVLMQRYHLDKRKADALFATLEERGMVAGTKVGKTTRYSATIPGGH
jgi:ribosomal protein S25